MATGFDNKKSSLESEDQHEFGNTSTERAIHRSHNRAIDPAIKPSLLSDNISDKNSLRIKKEKTKISKESSSLIDDPAILSALDLPAVKQLIMSIKGTGELLSEKVIEALGLDVNKFGSIKVHSDVRSQVLCDILGAKAFAFGEEIFFSNGSFSSFSEEGKSLLTHELMHIAQQDGTSVVNRQKLEEKTQSYEIPTDVVKDLKNQLEFLPPGLKDKFYAKHPAVRIVIEKGVVTDGQLDEEKEIIRKEISPEELKILRLIAEEVEPYVKKSNGEPKDAIKAYGIIKDKLKDNRLRDRFYKDYPHIISNMEANLPFEFLRDNKVGYVDGYSKDAETFLRTSPETSDPQTQELINTVLDGPKSTANQDKEPKYTERRSMLRQYWSLWKRNVGKEDIGKAIGIAVSGKKEDGKAELSNIDINAYQRNMGGHIAGTRLKNFNKEDTLTLKVNRENGLRFDVEASRIPIESINMFGSSYTFRTGEVTASSNHIVFNSAQKQDFDTKYKDQQDKDKDKYDLLPGTLTVDIGNLDLNNLIFQLPTETYAIGSVKASGFKITLSKDFFVTESMGILQLLDLVTGSLPAAFTNLIQAILQMKQRMAGAEQLDKNEAERNQIREEVLAGLLAEVSANSNLTVQWDTLDINNFITISDKVQTIKSLSTKKPSLISVNTRNNHQDLKQLKLRYKDRSVRLAELQSKSLRKQERKRVDIEALQAEMSDLEQKIAAIEKENRTTTSHIEMNGLEMEDGGYVNSMVSDGVNSAGMADHTSFTGLKIGNFCATTESTANGVTQSDMEVSEIAIASTVIEGIHYKTSDGSMAINGHKAVLTNVLAYVSLHYGDTNQNKSKDKIDSPEFKLTSLHADHVDLFGPLSVIQGSKLFAGMAEQTMSITGLDVSMPDGNFEELKIAKLENMQVELPSMMMCANIEQGVGLNLKSINNAWQFDSKEIDGTLEYTNEGSTALTSFENFGGRITYNSESGLIEFAGVKADDISLDALNWNSKTMSISVPSAKPNSLKGILLNGSMKVDPKTNDLQSLNLEEVKIDELDLYGLFVQQGDKSISMGDSMSVIKGLGINNLKLDFTDPAGMKTSQIDPQGTKDNVVVHSINLSPFIVKAKNAWNANITKFTSEEIKLGFLQNGQIIYDVDNLDVKGSVKNKDKESSQSSDINIDTKHFDGSYKSEMIGTKGDAHKVTTIKSSVDIPSITLNKLMMKSPELELKASGSTGLNNLKANFTLSISEPSENEKQRQRKEFQEMLSQLRKQPIRTPSEEKLLKEPKFEPTSTIDLTIHSLDLKTAYMTGLYAKATGDSKLKIVKDKVEATLFSKEREKTTSSYSITTTEYSFNPGDSVRVNAIKMEEFSIHMDDKNFDFGGKFSAGDDKNKALDIDNASIVQKSLNKFLVQDGSDVDKETSNTTIKAHAGGSIGKIAFNGSSTGDYEFSVKDSSLEVKGETSFKETPRQETDPTLMERTHDMLTPDKTDTTHAIELADQETAAKNGFNIFKAEEIRVTRNAASNKENGIDEKTQVIKLINPTIAPIRAHGNMGEGAIENYSVLLQGKANTTITIQLLDGNIQSIDIPDFELENISGELTMRESKEEVNNSTLESDSDGFDEYEKGLRTRNNEFNFLSASSGSVTINMFGESLTLDMYSWGKGEYAHIAKPGEESGWIDIEELVEWVSSLISKQLLGSGIGGSLVSADTDIGDSLSAAINQDGYYAISLMGYNLFVLFPNVSENLGVADPTRNWQLKEVARLSAILDYQMHKPKLKESGGLPEFIKKNINDLRENVNFSANFNLNIDLQQLKSDNEATQNSMRGYLKMLKSDDKVHLNGDVSVDAGDQLRTTLNFPLLKIPKIEVPIGSMKLNIDTMDFSGLKGIMSLSNLNKFTVESKKLNLKNIKMKNNEQQK